MDFRHKTTKAIATAAPDSDEAKELIEDPEWDQLNPPKAEVAETPAPPVKRNPAPKP